MNRTTGFLLLLQKDAAGGVVQLQAALDRPTFDKDAQALVTPAVATADEFESAVNALQAELDAMRERGVSSRVDRIERAGPSPPALADPRAKGATTFHSLCAQLHTVA